MPIKFWKLMPSGWIKWVACNCKGPILPFTILQHARWWAILNKHNTSKNMEPNIETTCVSWKVLILNCIIENKNDA
jgi:hypothetical protein